MLNPVPIRRIAGLREAGAVCPHCQAELQSGDDAIACAECGEWHHWDCWEAKEGCGSYECSHGRRPVTEHDDPEVLRISTDDLSRAVPLPSRVPFAANSATTFTFNDDPHNDGSPRRWNRMAIASLIVSIAGIPLFGVVTGLVGILLGSLAIARHSHSHRGVGVAVGGILLGVADVAGWVIGLVLFFQQPGMAIRIDDFEPDPAALKQLPPHILRAMTANALIHVAPEWSRLRGEAVGSGVVLRIHDGFGLLVTNRHVIDPNFAEDNGAALPVLDQLGHLDVKLIGQPARPATVVWVAPDGIDLALIRVPISSIEPQAAEWDAVPQLTIGDDVFAVGNPHGLGWTLTRGSLSQLRLNNIGHHELKVIQTSAAINPGNSGGGLYDKSGRLIGINTWTKDKRMAEGLSFAITFTTLLDLAPAEHELKAK